MSLQLSFRTFLFTSLVQVCIVGCTTGPTPQAQREPSPLFAEGELPFPKTAQTIYLNPKSIHITLRVYAGGHLAKFGHNHMITATQARGIVKLHPDITKTGFTLIFPVSSLVVDQPAVRAMAGPDFAKAVSEKDRQGTRRNMLGSKVLDAENHPFIEVTALQLSGKPPNVSAEIAIIIKGVTQRLTTPITLRQSNGEIIAIGHLKLSQQAFGITPFSILGGAIAVQDGIGVDYRLSFQAQYGED